MIFLEFITNFGIDCAQTGSFMGFPAWYNELVNHGKIDSSCKLVNFSLYDIWLIVPPVIASLMQAVAMISVGMIIWGGFKFMTSQGNPDQIQTARKTLVYAIAGLVLSISARALMNFVVGTLA